MAQYIQGDPAYQREILDRMIASRPTRIFAKLDIWWSQAGAGQ